MVRRPEVEQLNAELHVCWMGWSTSPNSLHLAVCSFGGQGGLLAYDDVMRTHRLKGEAASSRELSVYMVWQGLQLLNGMTWT